MPSKAQRHREYRNESRLRNQVGQRKIVILDAQGNTKGTVKRMVTLVKGIPHIMYHKLFQKVYSNGPDSYVLIDK